MLTSEERDRAIYWWMQANFAVGVSYEEAAEFVDVFAQARGISSLDEFFRSSEGKG